MGTLYKESILDVNLDAGNINRSFINRAIGEGDVLGDKYGFRCIKNGSVVSLAGCAVVGHFIRANGTTVVIAGAIENGDTAYVILPEACYAIEGNFKLSIKLGWNSGQSVETVRVVDGTVISTTDGTIIDPGGVLPDLSDYIEVVERAEAAAEIINAFSVTTQKISGNNYRLIVSTGA